MLVRQQYPFFRICIGVFLFGLVCGFGLVKTTQGDVSGLDLTGDLFLQTSQQPTFYRIAINNLFVLAIILLGAVTFGFGSIIQLFINGLVFGAVFGLVNQPKLIAISVLPHSVFELPAFWLAGTASLLVTTDILDYLRGQNRTLVRTQTRRDYTRLSALAVILVLAGAAVETIITPALIAHFG